LVSTGTVTGGIIDMGYVYASLTTTAVPSTLSTLSTGNMSPTNFYPTATGLTIDTNSNAELGDEQHYLISASELADLGIHVEVIETDLLFHGRVTCNFIKRKKVKIKFDYEKEFGHVYFFKSANSYKVGSSCIRNIKNRVRSQCPDKVLAVSKARGDFRDLEKKIHRMFAKNRVGRYEIFNDLTEKDVNKIKKLLGNTIAVEIKLRGEK
tara:strand:+ start:30 stop:656 length:627 start_codon:yes stop_codon:yes gene_type:complete